MEKHLGDKKLRVEPKEYSSRRASRLNQLPVHTPIRTPRRISPSANAALAMRLARNELENNYPSNTTAPPSFTPPTPAYAYEQWQTPHHYIPAHLFSPSPPNPAMFYGAPPGYGMSGGNEGDFYYHHNY